MTDENQQVERMTPLEFLEEVYTCNDLPLPTRMKAATAAAPYVHPKLAATAILTSGDMGDRLDRANARVAGLMAARQRGIEAVIEYIRGPKVIEGEAIKENGANSPVSDTVDTKPLR